jgi:phosphatidylglycerophosphatase A
VTHRELVQKVLRDPVHWPAFGFGLGLAPKAPGTFGSLLGLPIWWFSWSYGLTVYLLLALFLFFIGIWICGQSAKRLGVHDHGGIVWDEVVGMLLTMTFVEPSLLAALLGFGLFRLMDITKPWPIRDVDHRLHGGLGIMLDDVLAAVYAALALSGIQYLLLNM